LVASRCLVDLGQQLAEVVALPQPVEVSVLIQPGGVLRRVEVALRVQFAQQLDGTGGVLLAELGVVLGLGGGLGVLAGTGQGQGATDPLLRGSRTAGKKPVQFLLAASEFPPILRHVGVGFCQSCEELDRLAVGGLGLFSFARCGEQQSQVI
jgi:hypothetical protein